MKERQCQNWFTKFRSSHFSLRNSQRSDRIVEVDETVDSSTHEMAEITFRLSHVKSHIVQFLAGKNQKFFEHEIMTLPERWQKVIDINGQHLIVINKSVL